MPVIETLRPSRRLISTRGRFVVGDLGKRDGRCPTLRHCRVHTPLRTPGVSQVPSLGTVIVVLGPGDVLGDRYRLDEFVASGGMGQVFRATDKTLNRTVAVKVLLPGLTSDAEFGSRFRAEARIMASIGHKGV